jgi:hypothetical protein
MHVVTEDKAMTRAVSADGHLLALKDIHEVLTRAAADLGADGEAYEGQLLSIEEIGDWSVVGLNNCCVTLILDATLQARVEVQYEDLDHAVYDREDDRWIGAESASTQVDDEIDVEILVQVERQTGTVREAKVLTEEVRISGPFDGAY